jgi:hypothetical protein
MITTEEELGDWYEPVNKILDHFKYEGSKKERLLREICLIKKLEHKYGLINMQSIKNILEVGSKKSESLSIAFKILGHRGEYRICNSNSIGRIEEEEFDLCVVRQQEHTRLIKDIRAKKSLRAF